MDLEGHAPDSKSSSKWRAFRDDVQSVLKAFDGAKEWPDVIKCLNKLAKALDNKKYEKFVTIPEKLTLCKRLAQCLNPSLPAGVHQKALEVYELIFKKIGSGLGPDLPLYSMGLFPLFQNASTQIKPKLIEMYEAYYVPLGAVALAACIDGLVASILYGLEEENTKTYASTKKLLDSMCHAFLPEPALFYKALWKAIYINPQVRISGFNYLQSKLPVCAAPEPASPPAAGADTDAPPKKLNASFSAGMLLMLGNSPTLAWTSLTASILDDNDRVRRAALDCLTNSFRLHATSAMQKRDFVYVMIHSLRILTLNEQPSLRRLYNWFYGGEMKDNAYFEAYTKEIMIAALKALFSEGVTPASDPFYILMFLLSGQAEDSPFFTILPDIMWDVLCCVVKTKKDAGAGEDERGHRIFEILPNHMIWTCINANIAGLVADPPLEQGAAVERLRVLSDITAIIPLQTTAGGDVDAALFEAGSDSAADAEGSEEAATEGDSESVTATSESAHAASGPATDTQPRSVQRAAAGGYTAQEPYVYCVYDLALSVLDFAETVCAAGAMDEEYKLHVLDPALRLFNAVYHVLSAALPPTTASENGSDDAGCGSLPYTIVSRLTEALCRFVPSTVALLKGGVASRPPNGGGATAGSAVHVLDVMSSLFTRTCTLLVLLLEQQAQLQPPAAPAEESPRDSPAEGDAPGAALPVWFASLLGPALEGTPLCIVTKAMQTALDIIQRALVPRAVVDAALADHMALVIKQLWELLAPECAPYHPIVVLQLLTLNSLKRDAVKAHITAQMTGLDYDAPGRIEAHRRFVVLWNGIDALPWSSGDGGAGRPLGPVGQPLDVSGLSSCLFLLLDALKSDVPTLKALAHTWLVKAMGKLQRILRPLFQRLIDKEWEQVPTQILDHRRTLYVVNTLITLLEHVPQKFVVTAFTTKVVDGEQQFYTKLVSEMEQAASHGKLMTPCSVACNNYFALLVSTLLRIAECQLPEFPADSSNANVYRAQRDGNPIIHLRGNAKWDPNNLKECLLPFMDSVAMEKVSEPVNLDDNALCVRAVVCLRLLMRQAYVHLSGPAHLSELTAIAAGLTPAVDLILNTAILMESPVLQSELLGLLVVLLNQLHMPVVASASVGHLPKEKLALMTDAHLSGVVSTVVFLYTILHGVLYAGLHEDPTELLPCSLFALWVDVASALVPLGHTAMPKLVHGLVGVYGYIARNAVKKGKVAAIGSQLKHCLQGCKNIMFCLFSMDPLDLRDLGLAMTRECIPPGQLYPEVFGGVEVNPVATVRADSEKSPESPLEPQGYMAVVVPVSPHTVQAQEQFHADLGSVLLMVLQLFTALQHRIHALQSTVGLPDGFSIAAFYAHLSRYEPAQYRPRALVPETSATLNWALAAHVCVGAMQAFLNPLVSAQPTVVLRCVLKLLADTYGGADALLAGAAGTERTVIALLDVLAAATAEVVVKHLVEMLSEMMSPSPQVPTSRLGILGHEKPAPTVTSHFGLELVGLWFLTAYVMHSKTETGDLLKAQAHIFQVVQQATNSQNIFVPSFALRLLIAFLWRTKTGADLSSSPCLEDPKQKKSLGELMYKLIEGGVKMSLQGDPICQEPIGMDSPVEKDKTALAFSQLVSAISRGHDHGLFKALEREDKDKVFVGNLFTSAVSGVLRTKEDGQRLRSTLRIRICVCFLHQCLVAFPQCLKPIRKDVWDVLHEPFFFKVDRLTLLQWKSVFTLTVQSDIQWHYQDLMTRFAASQGGLFTGTDTIAKERTQLLRRLAFTMLTTPPDNAQLLLQILERLVEATKLGAPIATRHAILCFRVLILKASPQNLSLFWPSILHEMIRVLNKDSTQPKDVMLEALKAFDIAMVVLPQQFQTFKWVFVRENPDKDHSSMVNNSPYQPLISLQAGSARPLAIHDGAPHPSPRSPRPQSPARGRSPSGRSPRLDAPPAPLPDAKARSPRLDVPHAAFPEAKGRSPRLDGVLAQATESRGRSPKAEGAQAHGFSEHFNAPLLSFPEKYYSQIESVDVVAAAVCSDAPFETRIVYKPQSDGGAGPAWDSTSLQRPASARKVDVPHMEWLILGDMVDYSFFQTS